MNKSVKFYLYKLNFLYLDESFEKFDSVTEALAKMDQSIEMKVSNNSDDTLKFYDNPKFGDNYIYGVISNTQNEMVEPIYDRKSKKLNPLPDNQSPIHSTCFIYFKKYGIIAIQSMQRGKGPGATQVSDFLSKASNVRMQVLNIDKPSELKALEMFKEIKFIHLKIASPDAWVGDKQERAFGGIMKDADEIDGRTIDIKINAGRGADAQLNRGVIFDTIGRLLNGNKKNIRKLEIGGIDEDSESIITDLITDRYYIEFDVIRKKRIDIEYFNMINNKAIREFASITKYLEIYKELNAKSYISRNK